MDFIKEFEDKIKNISPNIKYNRMFLIRYLKLVQYDHSRYFIDNTRELEYFEYHHVLPKWAFPEYKTLKENLVKLPGRVHVLAHYLLMRAWPVYKNSLSVIRTSGQIHHEAFKVKNLHSKRIAEARRITSEDRKGKKRNFVASEEHKIRMSNLKKELYSDPDNRRKHSIACTGSKRTNTENMKAYANNRPSEHIENIRQGNIKFYENESKENRLKRLSARWNFIYVTPVGNFTHESNKCGLALYSKNNNKIITIHTVKPGKSFKIFNKSHIGRTPKEFGFYTIPFSEYTGEYEALNQVHPPEPNHEIASELNDYLLRYNLLH